MFSEGDKIVCIDIEPRKNDDLQEQNDVFLEKNKIYNIRYIFKQKTDYILLEESSGAFKVDRFVSLKDYRKQKLEKICSK